MCNESLDSDSDDVPSCSSSSNMYKEDIDHADNDSSMSVKSFISWIESPLVFLPYKDGSDFSVTNSTQAQLCCLHIINTMQPSKTDDK